MLCQYRRALYAKCRPPPLWIRQLSPRLSKVNTTSIVLFTQERTQATNNTASGFSEKSTQALWHLNSQLAGFHKTGQLEPAIKRLEKMLTHHNNYNQQSFEIVLSLCVRQRGFDAATHVHQCLRHHRVIPTVTMYTYWIESCLHIKSGQELNCLAMAEMYWDEMLKYQLTPNIRVLNSLFKVYKKSQVNVDRAYSIFDQYCLVREPILSPDKRTINLILSMLTLNTDRIGALRSYDILKTIIYSQKQHPVKIDIFMFNTVLDSLRRTELWRKFRDLLNLIKNPCGLQYNRNTKDILQLYHRRDSAEVFYKNTKSSTPQIPPSTSTSSTIVPSITEYDDVRSPITTSNPPILQNIFSKYCPAYHHSSASTILLNRAAYNSYLSELARQGQLSNCISLLKAMITDNLADTQAFSYIFSLCSRLQDLTTAKFVYSLYQTHCTHFDLNISSYNAFLHCFSSHAETRTESFKRLQDAMKIFNKVRIQADIVTFNTMLKLIRVHGPVKYDNLDTRPRFITRGLDAIHLYNYCKLNCNLSYDATFIFSLFRCFVPNENSLPLSIIETLPQLSQFSVVIVQLLQNCPVHQLHIGIVNAALDYCQRTRNATLAFKVYDILIAQSQENSNLKANEATVSFLIAACRQARKPELGLALLHQLMDTHSHPANSVLSMRVWNSALQLCATLDRHQEAIDILQAIIANKKTLRVCANEKSFETVIFACARENEPRKALAVAKEMQDVLGKTSAKAWTYVMSAAKEDFDFAWKVYKCSKSACNRLERKLYHEFFQSAIYCAKQFQGIDNERVLGKTDIVMEDMMAAMKEENIFPTSKTLELVSEVYKILKEKEKMIAIFEKCCFERGIIPYDTSIISYLKLCAGLEKISNLDNFVNYLFSSNTKHSVQVLKEIIRSYATCKFFKSALRVYRSLPSHQSSFPELTPNDTCSLLADVLTICNDCNEYTISDNIYTTMQQSLCANGVTHTEQHYLINALSADVYIEGVRAAEGLGDWVSATHRFMEMQKACDVSEAVLSRSALGRYYKERKEIS